MTYELQPIKIGCDFLSGYAFKSEHFIDKAIGIPVIKIKNIQGNIVTIKESQFIPMDYITKQLEKFYIYDGDILIAMTGQGSVGRVGMLQLDKHPNAILNQRVGKYLPKQNIIDKNYLYFVLSSNRYQKILFDTGSGSGQPNLSPDNILDVEIPFPPYPIQKFIGDTLISLEKKIRLLRRQNETLEQIAQTLFKRWFVDFEFPDENGRPYKSSGGEMVSSELGEIPDGWSLGFLKDLIDVNPIEKLKRGTKAKYVEMKFLSTTGMEIENYYERDFKSGSKFTNGDVLLARITPCLENGKTGYVNFLDNGEIGWGSTEFIVLRAQDDITNEFTYCLSRDSNFRSHAIKNMTGSSGRKRIPNDIIMDYKIVSPDKNVLMQFNKITYLLFQKINSNQLEIKTLENIRDSLLPKLMRGQMRFVS